MKQQIPLHTHTLNMKFNGNIIINSMECTIKKAMLNEQQMEIAANSLLHC